MISFFAVRVHVPCIFQAFPLPWKYLKHCFAFVNTVLSIREKIFSMSTSLEFSWGMFRFRINTLYVLSRNRRFFLHGFVYSPPQRFMVFLLAQSRSTLPALITSRFPHFLHTRKYLKHVSSFVKICWAFSTFLNILCFFLSSWNDFKQITDFVKIYCTLS